MRKTMWLTVMALAVVTAFGAGAAAQTMGRPVSRHAGSMSIFARGGGEQPSVAAVTTGLRHERVAHRRAATQGFHHRPARYRNAH